MIIKGTAGMMRKGSFKVFPGTATVRFLPAVHPQNFTTREALMDAVRQQMQSALAQP
jgi:1-acyl-sn-glycerol-3-phosphate acyltransferase